MTVRELREKLLNIAKKEVGYTESPSGSNRTKYGKWYGLDGNPWCMMFLMWVFEQADAMRLLPVRTASCGEFIRTAKQNGNWNRRDFLPGDIVIFDFPGNAVKTDHTGLVESVSLNHVMTIEGNTGKNDDANGGMVMKRSRSLSVILGAYRPPYAQLKPLLTVALDALSGNWGNDKARKKQLAAAGYDPEEVQRVVNGLCCKDLTGSVTASSLLIRSGPGTKYAKKGALKCGETVHIQQIKQGNGSSVGWGKTSKGWVAMDYITL